MNQKPRKYRSSQYHVQVLETLPQLQTALVIWHDQIRLGIQAFQEVPLRNQYQTVPYKNKHE